MIRTTLQLLLLMLSLVGCDRVSELASSAPHRRLSVVPSAPPKLNFQIVVRDERYMSAIARRLGTTNEAIIRDNDLADSTIQVGQRLRVQTTKRRFDEFERLQQVRADRRVQQALKKRQDAAAAVLAARLAKKKKRLKRRSRRARRTKHRRRRRARLRRDKPHKRRRPRVRKVARKAHRSGRKARKSSKP